MSIELIEDLGGVWSRPFVTNGDPYKIAGAIIGLNPATPIPTTYVSRKDFYRLVKNRQDFEAWYEKYRLEIDKRKSSPTRKCLKIIIRCLGEINVVETNVNAYPAENENELHDSPHEEAGSKIAKKYLRKIQPKFVIVHTDTALKEVRGLKFVQLGKLESVTHHMNQYVGSRWNDKPMFVFSVPRFARPPKGWSHEAIRESVSRIMDIVAGEPVKTIRGTV